MSPNPLAEWEATFVVNGRFRERDGPAARSERYCQKKLCLVATDKEHLVRLLMELLQRPDCFYVKYTPEPRDGMYLGRAFLLDEREVGLLWARLKHDPKVLCAVQDDDFILPYRDA